MTEKEAIEKIKQTPLMRWEEVREGLGQGELYKALCMAVQALEKQTMCNEILHEWKEAREKAIDEFAEKLCDELSEKTTDILVDGFKFDVLTLDGVVDIVWEIAERMKNGEAE